MASSTTELPARANTKRDAGYLLLIIRCLFVLILGGTAAKIANEMTRSSDSVDRTLTLSLVICAVFGIGLITLALDILYPRKKISTISAVFFGLIVGSILGYFLQLAFAPTLSIWFEQDRVTWFSLIVTTVLCYVCVSVLVQTKDDFRFVIPYIEFSPQIRGPRPLILDTSVIIDGRIADIADSGLMDQLLVIPRFVLDDVQEVADSPDKIRRKRGIRGLEIIDRLRRNESVNVDIRGEAIEDAHDRRDLGKRLMELATELGGRLVTNDVTLAKAAKIHNVATISLNDVSAAFKPPVLWGDRISVLLVKEGEEPGQGVGYLDDGTMVVVEMGKRFIGHEVNAIVDSFLQTSAGRMVFGRIDSKNPSPSHAS
ncbi:PIN/TRAM domain-containing protein [bacterium]|nr:PIN/TRAM domain-containing protein [bacterium]